MRTIDDHRDEILELLRPVARGLGSETIDVGGDAFTDRPEEHVARYLAADVVAPRALPGFDNSQMDGFAVLAADLESAAPGSPVALPVAGRIAAGDAAPPHRPGTATPIMTGAPLPPGADAVVPVERVDPPLFPAPGTEATIRFTAPVGSGTYVRAQGSDVAAGQVLLHAGDRLTPARAGVINGVGLTGVAVRRRLRVLLVPTGHEIRDPGEDLAPGRIHDSNSVALTAALQSIGCDVDVRPCRSDDAEDLLAILDAATRGEADGTPDLVITVGGVSAGAREVVRDALGPIGVRFEKVALQPGGPQGLGLAALRDGRTLPVVCLPGNPVSALVSFEAFLRGALLTTAGATVVGRERRRAPISHDLDSPPHVLQLRRGVLVDGELQTLGGPSSHLLHSLAGSTVLIHVPIGVDHVAAGTPLDFWRIDD
ncbi:gephyrin-like molybdotransferase Glp [Cnuibacter sp. UC19_7]|uniref:molybdopterin molybdotransferase MoeA n=1 Tax=Cnuibacter sp. UC19_7 TaxID=3350166 RepID=UPI00366C5C9E